MNATKMSADLSTVEIINGKTYELSHYYDTTKCYDIVRQAADTFWVSAASQEGRENYQFGDDAKPWSLGPMLKNNQFELGYSILSIDGVPKAHCGIRHYDNDTAIIAARAFVFFSLKPILAAFILPLHLAIARKHGYKKAWLTTNQHNAHIYDTWFDKEFRNTKRARLRSDPIYTKSDSVISCATNQGDKIVFNTVQRVIEWDLDTRPSKNTNCTRHIENYSRPLVPGNNMSADILANCITRYIGNFYVYDLTTIADVMRDSLSKGQLLSKLKVVDLLKRYNITSDSAFFIGHWHGLLPMFIYECGIINRATGIELDPFWVKFSNEINAYWDWKSTEGDATQSNIISELVINTSAEHMNDDWLLLIESGTTVCAQSTDYKYPTHINRVDTLEEFVDKFSGFSIIATDVTIYDVYSRFTVIAIKN